MQSNQITWKRFWLGLAICTTLVLSARIASAETSFTVDFSDPAAIETTLHRHGWRRVNLPTPILMRMDAHCQAEYQGRLIGAARHPSFHKYWSVCTQPSFTPKETHALCRLITLAPVPWSTSDGPIVTCGLGQGA